MLTQAFTSDGLEPKGHVLHPRWWVELLTDVDGTEVPTGIQPVHFLHHRGSHNKADEANITLDLTAFNFPIRLIGGAVASLYYGLVEEAHDSVKKPENERFFGVVVDYSIDQEARTAQLSAQDLSYLLRRKTYPVRKTVVTSSDGITSRTVDPTPKYSDTLRQAIERMISIVPEFYDKTVEAPLSLRDNDALNSANLAGLVNGRAVKAPIPLKPNCTVWEGIEHLCGLLGLHVRVELREIVIRTAEEVFAGRTSKATFVFGSDYGNSFGPKFTKRPVEKRNGVRVIAHDTEARKTVTAVYPSDTVLAGLIRKQPRRTRKAATKPSNKPVATDAPPPPRDVYELDPGHYTQAALDNKAKAIWLERSRQEADGEVSSPVWTDEVLNLHNGDLVTVKVNQDIAQQVASIGDDAAASKLLQEKLGYEPSAADALVRAARKPSRDDWYAKEISFEGPSEHLVTVHVINLVEV